MSGDGFTAELMEIYGAGAQSLPAVATIYAEMLPGVHNAGWQSGEAFEYSKSSEIIHRAPSLDAIFGPAVASRQSQPGYRIDVGQTMGAVYPAWSALRDVLHSVLYASAETLLLAGDVLTQVASAYAGCDTETQEALARIPVAEDPPLIAVGDDYETTTVTHDSPFGPPYDEVVLADEAEGHGD